MPVAPSFEDLLTVGQAEAQARRPDLVFADGDITEAQLHGSAAMGDACIRFSSQAFKETFIDGAQGDALSALVNDHLNIQRNAASFAEVAVEFSRTTSGAGGTILAGTTVATEFDANGETIEYVTDADFIVGAGLNGPFSIECTAAVAGRDGNATAGTVTRLIDQPAFDPNFTVTNPLAAAGGNDEESDEALRERARSFFATLRRGTLEALEFGAKVVPSVEVAVAVEDTQTGIVTVRVSDSDGNSTQQMIDDVITELENWRCAGSLVNVVGGSQLTVDLDITVAAARAGFDVAASSADLIDAVETRMEKLRVGETLFLDSVIGAIIGAFPDDVFDVTFTSITVGGSPAAIGDVVPTNTQVIRPGTITFA